MAHSNYPKFGERTERGAFLDNTIQFNQNMHVITRNSLCSVLQIWISIMSSYCFVCYLPLLGAAGAGPQPAPYPKVPAG
jgi:hypothetical protein